MEPYLFDFAGFADLEKDGKSMLHADRKILTGLEAFTLAYNALSALLEG